MTCNETWGSDKPIMEEIGIQNPGKHRAVHVEVDADVATNAENSAVIENHRPDCILDMSDKVNRGKAAGLTVLETSFSSEDRGMGYYGESAKEKLVDMETQLRAMSEGRHGCYTQTQFLKLKNRFRIDGSSDCKKSSDYGHSNLTMRERHGSGKRRNKKFALLDVGQAQKHLQSNHLELGSEKAQMTNNCCDPFLGSAQDHTQDIKKAASAPSRYVPGPLLLSKRAGLGLGSIFSRNFREIPLSSGFFSGLHPGTNDQHQEGLKNDFMLTK